MKFLSEWVRNLLHPRPDAQAAFKRSQDALRRINDRIRT